MTKIDEAKKIKAEIEELKKKTKILEAKPAKKVTKKAEAKPAKKVTKKAEAKPAKKGTKKAEAKPPKPKKLTKKELEEEKRLAERTVEDELEEQLTEAEIENFQIEKVDMERLTNKICDILAERESEGMFQSELWKKLKLSSRDGSRLSLKLEEWVLSLEKNFWKMIVGHTN